jgi:hypothetical protein
VVLLPRVLLLLLLLSLLLLLLLLLPVLLLPLLLVLSRAVVPPLRALPGWRARAAGGDTIVDIRAVADQAGCGGAHRAPN